MKCLNEREIIVQKWNVFAKYFMNEWNKMYEYMLNNSAFDFIDLNSNVLTRNSETNKQEVSISSNNTFDNTNSITSTNKSILDNLINLALADGEVTEKERAIILRKTESLGLDKDEVEMILEGKFLNKLVRTSKETEIAGNITKCPACGGIVKSFLINCQDCGHEFQNIAINESLLNFITKLENEETKIYQNVKYGIESHRLQQKINIIAQFPIPNNKSTIIEFIIYCLPMLENEEINNKERLAWKIKIEQSLNKLQMISKASEDVIILKEFQSKFNNAIAKYNKSRRSFRLFDFLFSSLFAILLLYFVFAAVLRIFGKHLWPF